MLTVVACPLAPTPLLERSFATASQVGTNEWPAPPRPHLHASSRHTRFSSVRLHNGGAGFTTFPRRLSLALAAAFLRGPCSSRKKRGACIKASNEPPGALSGAAFDLDLAVLLAGFSFESYNTPPQSAVLVSTEDAVGCRTLFLSPQGRSLLRQLYEGELRVTAVGARDCPALDMWNASDPYAVLTLGDCRARTSTKPVTINPNWNQTFTLYVKAPVADQVLRASVWDANLVAADRRMGVAALRVADVLDGTLHKLELPLQEDYGQGRLLLEVRYTQFSAQVESSPSWLQQVAGWLVGLAPSQSPAEDKELETLRKMLARREAQENKATQNGSAEVTAMEGRGTEVRATEPNGTEVKATEASAAEAGDLLGQAVRAWEALRPGGGGAERERNGKEAGSSQQSAARVDGPKSGAAVETGGEEQRNDEEQMELFKQGENAVGPWALLASLVGKQGQPGPPPVPPDAADVAEKVADVARAKEARREEERQAEEELRAAGASEAELAEVRAVFRRAESAVEAWSLLAQQAGQRSAVQSDFTKLAFLDHPETDTQAAIWRANAGRRLVVAFRGTEQTQWRDLATDLMLVSAGLNPERVSAGDPNEPAVHAGFLRAYDSVRRRIVAILEAMTRDDLESQAPDESTGTWTIYITGHSLGGALATLLARDVVRLPWARQRQAEVVMYNFGSPRVGNRAFAEEYNRTVGTSWRVCNHRDIIPTVPRLLGYCHVKQPIYFRGDLRGRPLGNDALEDDYTLDVIGETSADALLPELMRGEQALISQLVRTEIALLQSLQDGSGIMQHMEDFYYVNLLKCVQQNVQQPL
ncbi:hypothetical protein KFL_000130400 [Klebsormidium nitens]|uniref:C2 domain-containing protein n=1 Tax=Klebsormidium nitens TaxID=105231 RepID=A0A1Y1HRJ3_KLENI|nr:hypothetical protein KFL_000130400 [Klebsormidium nitens]|eukprot:GAQ78458.1 hypothetical protein KFL_000130400 [Klebsormidium nitens]